MVEELIQSFYLVITPLELNLNGELTLLETMVLSSGQTHQSPYLIINKILHTELMPFSWLDKEPSKEVL